MTQIPFKLYDLVKRDDLVTINPTARYWQMKINESTIITNLEEKYLIKSHLFHRYCFAKHWLCKTKKKQLNIFDLYVDI